nr:efflux pump roqt [Quercus suber]
MKHKVDPWCSAATTCVPKQRGREISPRYAKVVSEMDGNDQTATPRSGSRSSFDHGAHISTPSLANPTPSPFGTQLRATDMRRLLYGRGMKKLAIASLVFSSPQQPQTLRRMSSTTIQQLQTATEPPTLSIPLGPVRSLPIPSSSVQGISDDYTFYARDFATESHDDRNIETIVGDGQSTDSEVLTDNGALANSVIAVAESNYPKGIQFFLICSALALALTLGGLDGNIVATAVPAITDHFHTVADVGWYAAAYRLCSCALQFFFGKLYKLTSPKKVFLATTCMFLVGSIICATAPSSRMFVLGRAITGAGAAGINAGCFSVAIQILPLRKRPVFNGVMAGIESVSVITAPILGGVLTEKLSWRWCFWINLPVGALSLIAIAISLPNQTANRTNMKWQQMLLELDLVGNLVLIPCLTCLFIALSWAGIKYPWGDPKVIGFFVAFAGLLVVFATDQFLRGDKATLPLRILKNRNVVAGFIFSACTNGSASVLEYYMPTFFQAVRGCTPAESGYLMLPILVGFLIALLIQGGGTTMLGYYTPFMVLASVLMPIAAGLITTWNADTRSVDMLALAGFAGFATGIGFQGPQSAVQTTLPEGDVSTGLAIILFAQGFGPAVFLSAAQTIFTNRLSANLHHLAPGLDVVSIENMGLNDLKSSLGSKNLEKVVLGFSLSLSQMWYLTVGTTCLTMVGSLLTDWRSVKEKRT